MGVMSVLASGGGLLARINAVYTYAVNTADAVLNVSTLSGYTAGRTDITVTVNSGVYLWATAITAPGLTLTGGAVGDTITLVNNGFIMGKGGNGLTPTSYTTRIEAESGGPAVSTSLPITITNTAGYIGGGGGGGGGFWYWDGTYGAAYGGGGGAGGGSGGSTYIGAYYAGGAGGSIGQSGVSPSTLSPEGTPAIVGGGGGRVLPGASTIGTFVGSSDYVLVWNGIGGPAGGTGGASDFKRGPSYVYTSTGGGPGQAGSATGTTTDVLNFALGGGGGWGAAGSQCTPVSDASNTTPGAGGKAVALNGNTITWTGGSASSSRAYGAVS